MHDALRETALAHNMTSLATNYHCALTISDHKQTKILIVV
jgi:hypothetical protein